MYRLSPELAKEIMRRIKVPEIESSGPNAFLPKNYKSCGIIDPICATGVDFDFVLESPVPILYPELPHIPTLNGYFLYKRGELLKVEEEWNIAEVFVNPTCTDPEKKIDVHEAAVQVASDVDKLVAPTISTMEQLISKCPLILDCLDLSNRSR